MDPDVCGTTLRRRGPGQEDPEVRGSLRRHWVWKTDAPQNGGYARLKIDGRLQHVHVWWWELVNGPRPVGEDGKPLEVDHCCEYLERCVAPGCKRLLPKVETSRIAGIASAARK